MIDYAQPLVMQNTGDFLAAIEEMIERKVNDRLKKEKEEDWVTIYEIANDPKVNKSVDYLKQKVNDLKIETKRIKHPSHSKTILAIQVKNVKKLLR